MGGDASEGWGALAYAAPPVLTVLLALAVFELGGFGLAALPGPWPDEGLGQVSAARELRARLGWLAALLVFLWAIGATLAGSLHVLSSALAGRSRAPFAWSAGALFAIALAVGLGFWTPAFRSIYANTSEALGAAGYAAHQLAPVRVLVQLLNLLTAIAAILALLAGCACVLGPRAGRSVGARADEAAVEQVRAQARRTRTILHLGSVMLVAGILHMLLWLRWPAALVPDPGLAAELQGVAEAVALYWGAALSLLVAAWYVPVALRLAERARALAPAGSNREAWLEEHGLVTAPLRRLPQLAAILGPLVAGPVGAAFADLRVLE